MKPRNASNFFGLCTLYAVCTTSLFFRLFEQFKRLTENPFEFCIHVFVWKIPWNKKKYACHVFTYVNFSKWIYEQLKCNKANRSNSGKQQQQQQMCTHIQKECWTQKHVPLCDGECTNGDSIGYNLSHQYGELTLLKCKQGEC